MPRPVTLPTGPPCDMVRNCPRAWVVFIGIGADRKHLVTVRTCRQHATTAISHVQSTPGVKRVELRFNA
jgi:hypothetical protein